jgi:hypothetical protein
MLAFLRKSTLPTGFILILFALSLLSATPLPAQERYPAVARLSFVSGPVTYSRGDDPDEWDDAIENVPLTIGDRIYAPEDGRAELQLSSGNFVRIAPRSYLSTLNLSDDIKQFYLGEGAASFHIRRLQSDEVIEIDTPNVSVTLDEPGRYRIAVDEAGNSRITVRRGKVIVAASGRQIAVENSEIRVYGIDSPRYEIVGLPATDAFDRWVTERDDRFERTYSDAYRHASDDIIGAEDLAEFGRWEEIPEYGYAWTPSRVAAGWAPFSDGRWYWQDPWGWSWISNERWGWATSHYGRWTPYRSRWYWVPVRPRTRVRYAPAVVEFVRVRDHVAWFPLHPRDRHIPWWERRDRQSNHQHITYVNRTYVTVINHNHFISARPLHRHIVRDSVIVNEARSARFTAESLPIPTRSSLRVVSETGARRGHRPSANVLNRAAVVRTAPPAPPPTFQEKLTHIQKSQGKPVEPSTAAALASQDDRARANRVRIRPAAEQTRGGDFAPRNPGATSGPTSQPLTEARGKKLATRENTVDSKVSAREDRAQKTPPPQQPSQPSSSEPSKGTASRPESPRLEQRDGQRQEKQTLERERQAQQQKQEQERKAQLQQKQEQERQEQLKEQQLRERQAQQQKQQELEGKQQAQQREEEGKTQLQNRQEQERREQLRQQQIQERQAQQQRQQELERRQQQQQQEQERKVQAQQQQDQVRREQLRQQQAQERQAREQQRQQELEGRQQQQQREQDRNAQLQRRQEQASAQQPRQQPAQEQRDAQPVKRQQERPQQLRQQPLQERQLQQPPRQPGQF